MTAMARMTPMPRMTFVRLLMILAVVCVGSSVVARQDSSAPVQPVQPGQAFPPLMLQVLEPGAPAPRPLDFAKLLGKRPIVLVQFGIGSGAGEGIVLSLQEMGLKGDIALMGAIQADSPERVATARRRLTTLGIKLPVIVQDGPTLGLLLGGTKTAITLIDHKGVLRVAGAGGLKQKIGDGPDVEHAIRSAAAREPVPTAGPLPAYQSADDLIGERFPDFALKALTGEEVTLSKIVGKAQRVTAVLFWHPDSKESFQIMSGVVAGVASYNKWIDVISVADLRNEDEVKRAREFAKTNGMTFPVLKDEERKVQARYRIGTLATMFFIRPDGIVDSVYTGTNVNYVPIFSVRIRRILKVGKEYEGGAAPK